MNDVEVRAPRTDEAEAVARCQLACWREAYADLVDPARLQPSLDDVDGAVERWRQILAGPARVSVAVSGGRFVGFATVRPGLDGEPDHLAAIYVRRDRWSTGLGQRLLDAALGDAPATLRVFRENARAVRFYTRNGFVPDGNEAEEPHWGGVEIGMVRADSEKRQPDRATTTPASSAPNATIEDLPAVRVPNTH